MAFVPAPNIVQAEWRCTRNGQKVENTLHINMLAEPNAADMTDLAIVLWNWWENNHSDLLVPEVLLNSVVLTSLHAADGPQVTYAPDTTTVGQLGGFALPNEVSQCVKLTTGHRGRSARGRWYMLSISDAQLADTNSLTSVAGDAMVVSLQQLINAISAEGYQASIVSYVSNKVPRPGGPVYFPIQAAAMTDLILDSQRRRKPGVGE